MGWKGFSDIRATVIINLKKSEEELWGAIDKDAKWGVKKAEKENLEIRENGSFEDFYEIYKETCRFGGINPNTPEKIKINNPKFFFCYKESRMIAGSAIIFEGKKFRLYLNASNHEFLKYQPNNLLYWQMILWGGKNGFEEFDLGGYQLNTQPGDKLYNINRFKERWGGQIVTYKVYFYNPFYVLGRKAIRNSKFFWKLNNKLRGRTQK